MNRTKTVTGFCPHINGTHSIEIEFVNVSYKGNPDSWKRDTCPIVRLPEARRY